MENPLFQIVLLQPHLAMLILLVDDDAEDRAIFQEALKEVAPGNILLTAINGEEALKLLDQLTLMPEVVFLDINMPLMNGKVCLITMREDQRFRDIPVVIYSTSVTTTDKKTFAKLGASVFLKPSSFLGLKEQLKVILHQPSA